MATDNGPRNNTERRLGFRVEIAPGGENGSVVYFSAAQQRGEGGVRPATGPEIALWTELMVMQAAFRTGGIPAESVVDPFGTPKAASDD